CSSENSTSWCLVKRKPDMWTCAKMSSHLSRKCRNELLSDVFAIEDFYVGNRPCDNVKDHHSYGGVYVHGTKARAVTSFRLLLGIERRAEVVSTSAAVYGQPTQTRPASSEEVQAHGQA